MTDRYALMELPIPSIAQALSCCSDYDQAELLNTFGKKLRMVTKGSHNADAQLCWVADKLDADGKALVNSLAEFIKLKEEEPTS